MAASTGDADSAFRWLNSSIVLAGLKGLLAVVVIAVAVFVGWWCGMEKNEKGNKDRGSPVEMGAGNSLAVHGGGWWLTNSLDDFTEGSDAGFGVSLALMDCHRSWLTRV
ncbi:hypothetical protein FXO37_14335 [Capsicum annuum]|nr:hypothetical protein FXO37_14335 [Capsicum annuum]